MTTQTGPPLIIQYRYPTGESRRAFLSCRAGLLLSLFLGVVTLAAEPPNQLTPEEKRGGWKLLFDGENTQGWHSFKKTSFPAKGWEIDAGWLHCSGNGGGDLISDAEFEDFEFSWEWKITPGGNSGVKYFVLESRNSPLGHEYQMIDDDLEPDASHGDGKRGTASFYDVLAPDSPPLLHRAGQTNQSQLIVKGNHVEHWLNGRKVLEYVCGSQKVTEAVANSKFKNTPGFGNKVRAHLLLQDHRSNVWFRNLKIRPLNH
jgi:hypothetical protein